MVSALYVTSPTRASCYAPAFDRVWAVRDAITRQRGVWPPAWEEWPHAPHRHSRRSSHSAPRSGRGAPSQGWRGVDLGHLSSIIDGIAPAMTSVLVPTPGAGVAPKKDVSGGLRRFRPTTRACCSRPQGRHRPPILSSRRRLSVAPSPSRATPNSPSPAPRASSAVSSVVASEPFLPTVPNLSTAFALAGPQRFSPNWN